MCIFYAVKYTPNKIEDKSQCFSEKVSDEYEIMLDGGAGISCTN